MILFSIMARNSIQNVRHRHGLHKARPYVACVMHLIISKHLYSRDFDPKGDRTPIRARNPAQPMSARFAARRFERDKLRPALQFLCFRDTVLQDLQSATGIDIPFYFFLFCRKSFPGVVRNSIRETRATTHHFSRRWPPTEASVRGTPMANCPSLLTTS